MTNKKKAPAATRATKKTGKTNRAAAETVAVAKPAASEAVAEAPQKNGKSRRAAAEPVASAPTAAEVPPKRSALESAVQVLREEGRPMNCGELIATMAAKNYWTSPGGKTPASTLYAAILKEVTTKGTESRFVKVARGQFALRETVK